MRSRRRLVASALTAALVGLTVLAAGVRPVHAQVAADCTISGTGVVNPGLGPLLVAEVYSFSGSQGPCTGVNGVAGPISGFMTCPEDTIQACAGAGSFQMSSSPEGSCRGSFTHQGVNYSFACTGSGSLVISGSFVLTPLNGTTPPIVNYGFTGDMSITSP